MSNSLILKVAIVMMIISTNAIADDHQKRMEALQKEYDALQPKLHECFVAMEKATRNGNVWDEDDLTMAECKARGYESIDLGQRMISESGKE